jgi:hypothetical protein
MNQCDLGVWGVTKKYLEKVAKEKQIFRRFVRPMYVCKATSPYSEEFYPSDQFIAEPSTTAI